MPFVLSDERVCQPDVPIEWVPVLQELARFIELEQQLRESSDSEGSRAELEPGPELDSAYEALTKEIREVHDRLIAGSNELLEPKALDDLDDLAIHRMFARAVFLTMRIEQAVAGDDEILDTAGCRTLPLYEADFYLDCCGTLHDALRHMVDLDEEELHSIETQVDQDIQPSARKHMLVRAIRDHFGLYADEKDLRLNVFRFFESLYPQVGLVPEEVEVIVAGTMIFFCLPFKEDELTTERFQKLSTAEQQPTREFLKRVNRFSQWQFAHFPVFGFRKGEDLDPTLLQALAQKSKLPVNEVATEISTLTAIIPITQLDKYVVHDIYGHSWQACMLSFDELYRELADYADPLDLDETARVTPGDESRMAFRDCFVGSGEQLELDENRFRRFAELEVAERLPAALAPVIAELLADVAEFKIVDEKSTAMPTSSALKHYPAKLDLTMRDVLFYFSQATKVFRLWANRNQRQTRTADQLVALGAAPAAAERCVQRAVALWNELEEDRFAAKLCFDEHDGKATANVACRLALNFMAIHRETLRVYERLSAMDLEKLPAKGLRDLMLICVAVFFEQSPTKNLWRVDEFLTLKIEPLCEQLVK